MNKRLTIREISTAALSIGREMVNQDVAVKQNEWSNHPSVYQIVRVFGTWKDFRISCGDISSDDTLREQAVAIATARTTAGLPVTHATWDDVMIKSHAIIRLFGTWKKFRSACGLHASTAEAREVDFDAVLAQVRANPRPPADPPKYPQDKRPYTVQVGGRGGMSAWGKQRSVR